MSRADPEQARAVGDESQNRKRAQELKERARTLEQREQEIQRRKRERKREREQKARERERRRQRERQEREREKQEAVQKLRNQLQGLPRKKVEMVRDKPGGVNDVYSHGIKLSGVGPLSMEQMSEAAEQELRRRHREMQEARAPSGGLLDRLSRSIPSWALALIGALGSLALIAVM